MGSLLKMKGESRTEIDITISCNTLLGGYGMNTVERCESQIDVFRGKFNEPCK